MKRNLNPSIDNLYEGDKYSRILETGFVGFFFRWFHKTLEHGLTDRNDLLKVLELGAGGGQHSAFVEHKFEEYLQSDLRPSNLANPKNINNVINLDTSIDATNLPFETNSIDRIVASCLLIHIPESQKALNEWKRVVRPGGLISIYIPTEPSILLRFSRNLTTARKAKRLGIDALHVHYLEHLHNWQSLNAQITEVFGKSNFTRKNYPLNLGFDLSLWSIYQVNVVKQFE